MEEGKDNTAAGTTTTRYSLRPIQHPDVYENYVKQKERFWDAPEIDHGQDYRDWKTMNKEEQHYISMTLAFFANSDNAVMENLSSRFLKELDYPEAQMALSAQMFFETIHVVSYNNMIDAVIKDPKVKYQLFHAADHHPIVAEKIDMITKWTQKPDTPLTTCLAAQCFAEGVGFCSSFAAMMWLRKNQKCPGIGFGNEKIQEDESLHVRLFALFYKKEKPETRLKRSEMEALCRDFVNLEEKFVDVQLPYDLRGMNKRLMKQFVHRVADTVLELMNEAPLYNESNPFPWMEGVGLMGKSNFFEKVVGEYQKTREEDEIQSLQLEDDDELDF